MGHKTETTYHLTKESAQVAQDASGQVGYSETYGKGVFPCVVIDHETGEKRDGFKSITEIYYG